MQTTQQHKASPVVEKGFLDALAEFKKRLSPSECNEFEFTTLDDLRRAMLDIQTRQAAKAECMNLTRLQGFLEGFKQLGGVVEVFLNASQFVAFVWGPMKFLLNVASNYAERFDTLLRAYEQIGECLPLVAQHRQLFTGESHMDEVLVYLYRDILTFHRGALRIFELPTWRQVFGSVWKNFESQFGHILQDLRRHKGLIESQATVIHFRTYQEDQKEASRRLKQIEDDISHRRYQSVMQWLVPTDCVSDHQLLAKIREESVGSGTWLLKHPKYASWRTDDVPRSALLWLNGIPGAGKSVLASAIIDHCNEEKDARVAFFYCKHGDDQRTATSAILRSLISQLIDPRHILLGWCFEQLLNSGQPSLTSQTLCIEIIESILATGDKTFFLIDGLDECPHHERKALLSSLTMIITACEARNPGKVRIMLVSQDEPDIRKVVASATEIALGSSDNENDIRAFVKRRCDSIRERFHGIEDGVLEHIRDYTCHYADGMFLFAELVMLNLINQRCLTDLEQEIWENFPKGLDQAYARILQRISTNPNTGECGIAKQVLAWMTCAKRPLTWPEIQGAISIDVENETIDFRGRSSPVHIRDICGSLVTHVKDKRDDRLELVHNTAKRYLVESDFVDPLTAHVRLASLTLRYLAFPDFNADRVEADRERLARSGFYAFLDYSAVHWSDHLVIAFQKMPDGQLPAAVVESKIELEAAISAFAEQYNLEEFGTENLLVRNESSSADHGSTCKGFRSSESYTDLLNVFRFLHIERTKGLDGLDAIGPPPLDEVLLAVRSTLERVFSQQSLPSDTAKTLKSYYGQKWFKCPKASCHYFHEGFPDPKSRQSHLDRHDRPFRCAFPQCFDGFKLGFAKRKELDNHTRFQHPDEGAFAVTFARIRKAKEKERPSQGPKETKHPAKHPCNICDRRFTRASILRTHVFTSHENVKPHACVACTQRFARSNDLKRHMTQVHKDEAAFICRGPLNRGVPGSTWGCDMSFPSVDDYLGHMRNDAGKKCIQPLLDEEADERKLQQQIEQRKAQGLELPNPQGWVDSKSDHAGASEGSLPVTPGRDDRQDKTTNMHNAWKPFGGAIGTPLAGITGAGNYSQPHLQSSQRTDTDLSEETLVTPEPDSVMESFGHADRFVSEA